jgi:hypothetical protein
VPIAVEGLADSRCRARAILDVLLHRLRQNPKNRADFAVHLSLSKPEGDFRFASDKTQGIERVDGFGLPVCLEKKQQHAPGGDQADAERAARSRHLQRPAHPTLGHFIGFATLRLLPTELRPEIDRVRAEIGSECAATLAEVVPMTAA